MPTPHRKAIAGVILSVALMAPAIAATLHVRAGASRKSAGNAMIIIRNRGGIFTIQKKPANGASEDSKAANGLVIPLQVVVPFVSAVAKRNACPRKIGAHPAQRSADLRAVAKQP